MLTKPDLNQNIPEPTECIVCFSECATQKSDVSILQCNCKYYIHNDCFRRWIIQNEGQIRCIICRKNYPVVTVITSGIYYTRVDDFRNEMEQRMDNFNYRYTYDCMVSCLMMFAVVCYLLAFVYEIIKRVFK